MPEDHQEVIDTRHGETPKPTSNSKSRGESSSKEPRKSKSSLEKQATRKGKASGEIPSTSKPNQQQIPLGVLAPNPLSGEVAEIKQQLTSITGSLAHLTPLVTEIKTAYDKYNQAMDEMSESDPELPAEDGGNDNKSAEEGEIREPPKKKPKKELTGVLADMAKMVNEPLQNGEDLDSDLSDLLTELLSKGAGKDQREELINKLPTPGNCKRLDVVRVNTEIFNNVSKDVKTEDVMLQKAQKSLIKGITGVANVLRNSLDQRKMTKHRPKWRA